MVLACAACGGRVADDTALDAASPDASAHDAAPDVDATAPDDAAVSDASLVDASAWPLVGGPFECSLYINNANVTAMTNVIVYVDSSDVVAFGCHGFVGATKYTLFAGVALDNPHTPQWAQVDIGATPYVASPANLTTCVFAPSSSDGYAVDGSAFVTFSCGSIDSLDVTGKLVANVSPKP
jgi:hypothetical protein